MSTSRDFSQLSFSLYKRAADMMMFESYYREGVWDEGRLSPFHMLELSPAANILNYGQGIFEGMKAHRSNKGRIVMFRPEANARRFADSCRKIALPLVAEDTFMAAIRQLVSANEEFVPESDNGRFSMYIRPVCVGTEPLLGVRASKEALFYIFASPVGPYFDKVGVVKLMVTDTHRAALRGTGNAKAAANYAVTMGPKIAAKAAGFDEALYLDSREDRFVEEAGAANFFALLDDDTLVTPQLGSILPGITRDSILRLARESYRMRVEERPLSIDEICRSAKECFVCGTGAIITSVSHIHWKNETYNVNRNDYQMALRVYNHLIGIQLERREDPYGWVTVIKE